MSITIKKSVKVWIVLFISLIYRSPFFNFSNQKQTIQKLFLVTSLDSMRISYPTKHKAGIFSPDFKGHTPLVADA